MGFSAVTSTIVVSGALTGGATGTDGKSLRLNVNQPSHPFSVGNVAYRKTDGTYDLARSTGLSSANAVGVVESVNGDDFVLVLSGKVSLDPAYSPYQSGTLYYLSSVTGGITSSAPINAQEYSNPLLVGLTSNEAILYTSLITSPIGTSLAAPIGSIISYSGEQSQIPERWRLCNGDALSKGRPSEPEYNGDLTCWGDLESCLNDQYYIIADITGSGLTGCITFKDGGDAYSKNHLFEVNDRFLLRWPYRTSPSDAYTDEIIVKILSASSSINTCQFEVVYTKTAGPGLTTTNTIAEIHGFENIGSTSSNKFFIPDLRSRTVIGGLTGFRNLTSRPLGFAGGDETVALESDELPAHTHVVGVTGTGNPVTGVTNSYNSLYAIPLNFLETASSGIVSDVNTNTSASPHKNIPPYITTNWIIRYLPFSGINYETGPAGARGERGIEGARGSTGPTGNPGVTGPTGDPGPIGPTGDPGPTGNPGATGSIWRTGVGVPSNSTGVDGDYYLDTTTSILYVRVSGTYSVVSSIRGATGDPGIRWRGDFITATLYVVGDIVRDSTANLWIFVTTLPAEANSYSSTTFVTLEATTPQYIQRFVSVAGQSTPSALYTSINTMSVFSGNGLNNNVYGLHPQNSLYASSSSNTTLNPNGSASEHYIIGSEGSLNFEFDYGTYHLTKPITLADTIISDSPSKVQIYPNNTLLNFIESLSGNFGVTGTSGNYRVSFSCTKTSTTVSPILANDFLIFDKRVNSDFLQGAHRVLSATATNSYDYDIVLLNTFNGATGITFIDKSVYSITGSIKTADVVFSLGDNSGLSAPYAAWVLNSPNKCVSFNMTGPTNGLDMVFTGWNAGVGVGGATGIGVYLKNGAVAAFGERVWFTDLAYGIVSDHSRFGDSEQKIL